MDENKFEQGWKIVLGMTEMLDSYNVDLDVVHQFMALVQETLEF